MKDKTKDQPERHHDHHPVDALRGRVAQYLTNPRGEVDGLLLEDGTFVKFPPHLERELVQVARKGDEITVNGHREGARTFRGHVVVNAKTGAALREIKPAPPDRAAGLPALKPVTVAGKIRLLRTNGHDDVDGAVLADGTLVHFPPHAGKQFGALLAEGRPLAAAGFGVVNPHGRSLAAATLGAAADSLQAIHPPAPKPKKEADKHGHSDRKPRRDEDEDEDDAPAS